MRSKLFSVLSCIVLFSVLVVSCGPGAAPEEPAEEPAAEEPAAEEPAAEEPAAEEPAAEEEEMAEFDWKRFEGSEINLLFNEHPYTDELRPYIGEFEELTGITVNLESFAEDLYWDRMQIALRSDTPVADVYWEPMEATSFVQWSDDLIAPLSPYIDDPTMTSPDYDVEDFPEGFRIVALYPPGEADAELYGIPITFEAYILFYNKELVDKYLDGEVPQTMDELVAASQKVAAEGGGVDFGTVLRGNRDTITTDFVSALVVNCLGGDPTPLPYNMYFDGDWAKPRFTEPLVEEGFNQYATLMQTGPPGILAMDWYEASTSFQQGHVAFFIDASLFSPGFENPDESAIAGKVGYMPIPVCGDNAESYTTNWMWGLGIPANSENKDAAWYFIQWVTSKEMEAKLGVATGGAGRVSTWSDPDYVASLNPDYVVAVEEAMQTSRPAVVFSEYWAEVALGITDSVHAIYEGEDAAEVLQAQQDFTLEIVQQ